MVVKKIQEPSQEQIVSRNKYIVNDIYPISLKATPIELDKFIILFQCHQDYDDSYIYIQAMFIMENEFIDKEFFNKHPLNVENISRNDITKNTYAELLSKLQPNGSNLYICDLKMDIYEDNPTYYHATAIRPIDQKHASILDLCIPRDNFVKISLYYDSIVNRPFSFIMDNHKSHEFIFSNPKLHNIEFVKIEEVKLDATRTFLGNESLFISHYTMHCGPSEFKMNYPVGCVASIINDDGDEIIPPLKIALDKSLFDPLYSNDIVIEFMFIQNDFLYILYEEKSIIDNSFKKMYLLRLTKDLYDKTNFVNPKNIFELPDKTDENN